MAIRMLQDFIPAPTRARPGITGEKRWIVIHETANTTEGADARSYARYLHQLAQENQLRLSWHYTVDDRLVIQHMPDEEIAWHAGDDNPEGGNRAGIGVELCVHTDGDFLRTLGNAAALTAKLLETHGLSLEAVRQHYDFSGKDCPQRIRSQGLWESFLADVRGRLPTSPKKAYASSSLAEGMSVRVSGMLYADSYGVVPIGPIEGAHRISLLYPERPAGVLLAGALGWVRHTDCKQVPAQR